MEKNLQFFCAGDRAVLVKLGEGISEEVNDRVRALYHAIIAAKEPAIVEAVPSYTSVLVHYQPELCSEKALKELLSSLYSSASAVPQHSPCTLVVPVCYGLHFGQDIWDMQQALGMTRQDIIDIHTGRDYRIYMLGFLPGFVYLGGLDERIAYPRLAKPRLRVEAGAVGIAGAQTGIYPSASPGGWRIIGRTPLCLFDAERTPPVPVSAGDAIRFRSISADEYYEIKRQVLRGEYAFEIAGGGGSDAMHIEGNDAAASGRPVLKVISAGPLASVQDGGRFGHQAQGLTQAGAMDSLSLVQANRLVGNEDNAAALELTLFGGVYEALSDCRIALAGADMHPLRNEESMRSGEAIALKAGDRLRLGAATSGLRTYLAVCGGIAVPRVLGSRSTDIKAGFGGLQGRCLKSGDVLCAGEECGKGDCAPPFFAQPLQVAQDAADAEPGTKCTDAEGVTELLAKRMDAEGVTRIRFLYGPQDERFGDEARAVFTQSVYTVSAASDRMGYRLEGPAIAAQGGTDILSDGICFGSVQVPADGRPIVMMADHQTAGGYAKIATVVSADLPLLAQLGPGSRIRFCEAHEA